MMGPVAVRPGKIGRHTMVAVEHKLDTLQRVEGKTGVRSSAEVDKRATSLVEREAEGKAMAIGRNLPAIGSAEEPGKRSWTDGEVEQGMGYLRGAEVDCMELRSKARSSEMVLVAAEVVVTAERGHQRLMEDSKNWRSHKAMVRAKQASRSAGQGRTAMDLSQIEAAGEEVNQNWTYMKALVMSYADLARVTCPPIGPRDLRDCWIQARRSAEAKLSRSSASSRYR
jgi:hypothetical protein